jgi:hypothetical protein
MKCILYPNPYPDQPDNLSRWTPVPESEAKGWDWCVEHLRRAGLIHDDYWIVDETDLPGGAISVENDHNYFFDAWEWKDEKVQPNMPKARVIHMDRIRSKRDAALAALDVPFMRAVEAGDTDEQERIAAEKQVLRDIPQTLDLDGCATPEALGAAWPEELR